MQTKAQTDAEILLGRFRSDSDEPLIGIDEVGAGCLSGNVYACAVLFKSTDIPPGIDDSKKVSEKNREKLFPLIHGCAYVGVGMATVQEIFDLNILEARMLAMRRAFTNLPVKTNLIVVDGDRDPGFGTGYEVHAITGADAMVKAVGAASIVAKVIRDREMCLFAEEEKYSFYDWKNNKGYGTPKHLAGIISHGITDLHRKGFAPVNRAIRERLRG